MSSDLSPVGNLQLTVEMVGARIASHELVGVMGNQKSLGKWSIQDAPLMTRSNEDYNIWSASITLPLHKWVRYRYFIGVLDKQTHAVQVRRWEVAERARELRLTGADDKCYDRFGFICPSRPKLRRAWLNTGHVVLFKLFYEALQFHAKNSIVEEGEVIQIKVEPADPVDLLPIAPSARAQMQYTKMIYGNSQLKDQPEFGVPYSSSTLIFHTYLMDRANVGYLVKLFAFNERTECVRLIAHSYLPPEALEASEGAVEVTLASPNDESEVAILEMRYLVVNAMPDWHVKLNITFMQYWPVRWKGLIIGHRGMGRSFVPHNPASVPENTVSSIKKAFKVGADMVEFDVMLTKDMVPIIYHDFCIKVCLNSESPSSQNDIVCTPLASLTYDELQAKNTYGIIDGKITEYPAPKTVYEEDERLFPTLQDFFTKAHKMLGFNIEVKWPQELYAGGVEGSLHLDKNKYVDAILDVVKRYSWGRLCVFSSFDADICIMLRYKQNIYPVLLLLSEEPARFVDPRTHCLHPGVNTAQAFDLTGIAPSVSMLQQHPDTLAVANRQNKWVVFWGEQLSDRSTIDSCRAQGAYGLILDRIDLMLDSDKRNIFEIDEKLHKLFELQQSCGCR